MKILLYTDLTIRPDQLFWHRDLGLLTKAFRDLGHNALLVVHPAGDTPSKIKHPDIPPFSKSNIKHPTSKILEDPVLWPSHIPTSAASNIRAQARPATAGKNPPVAGALQSSDCYSESSEVGPPSHIPPFSKSNIKHPTSKILEDPVLWPSPSQVQDKEWWQSQNPHLVILGL